MSLWFSGESGMLVDIWAFIWVSGDMGPFPGILPLWYRLWV